MHEVTTFTTLQASTGALVWEVTGAKASSAERQVSSGPTSRSEPKRSHADLFEDGPGGLPEAGTPLSLLECLPTKHASQKADGEVRLGLVVALMPLAGWRDRCCGPERPARGDGRLAAHRRAYRPISSACSWTWPAMALRSSALVFLGGRSSAVSSA